MDLHAEFIPTESVKCTVDTSQRQCSGVVLTSDSYMTNGLVKTIQALKFSKVGDFNYMIYTSRNKQV